MRTGGRELNTILDVIKLNLWYGKNQALIDIYKRNVDVGWSYGYDADGYQIPQNEFE